MARKQQRHPFLMASKYHAPHLLTLAHVDLCGPITQVTHGGKKLFLLDVDDKSRYMCLVLLASKHQATSVII